MNGSRHHPPAISPEFAFVCACAAPGDPPGADTTLDGDLVTVIAHRHQVVPLVIEALRRAGRPVPDALVARFDPLAPLRAAREAVRLRTMLEVRGIKPIFLKGSTLAMLAYGSLSRRQFSDIDLLVDPSDAGRAAGVLASAGYRAAGVPADALADRVARLTPVAKDLVLHHPDASYAVELHWRLTDNPGERPVGSAAIQPVELAPGASVATLATEALFAYLCAHGAAHCWARLRWLADVAGLIAIESDGGDRLWASAVGRRQGRAAASAILLCYQFFGTPPPPSFARPRSLRLTLLLCLSRRVIEAGGGSTEHARTRCRGWAEMTGKLLIVSSAGDLRGWLTRLLFSAQDEEGGGATLRWRYVLQPLWRIPRLVRRRRQRRRSRESGATPSPPQTRA